MAQVSKLPKHSKAAVKAHPAPDRATYHDGNEYAEACRLVNLARIAFDVPNPLKLNGKEWNKSAVAEIVCARIASSTRGITSILEQTHEGNSLPDYATWMRWIAADKEICDKYTRAKEEQADFMAEEMLEIADNGGQEPLVIEGLPILLPDGSPVMVGSNTAVQHAKLRVETRKWLASKLKPKKYGEKLDLTAAVTVQSLTDDQLLEKARMLGEKLGIK